MSIENELPEGWAITRLEDICTIIMGQSPPSSEYNENGEGLPFFQGKAEFTDLFPEVRKWCTAPSKVAQANDILLSVRAPVGPTNLASSLCCIGRGLAAIRPEDNVEVRYVLYAIRTFNSNLVEMATGSTFEAISGDVVRMLEIPIAPTNEQSRIVAAIEQQFSRLDAAVAFLHHARAKLKRQRAAILKAAVEGTLTADSRAQHPTSETAEQLLQRILQERRTKWEAEQLAKMQDRGVTPKDDKWKEAYKEPESPDTTNLPELPKGWTWARAEQLCEFITKGTTPSAEKLYRETGEVPFIKVYNLTDRGLLDFSISPTFVSKQTHSRELARSKVFPGDVLMNIVGPPLGKVSIVSNLYPEWNINQAIAFFRPLSDYNRKLLCYALLTEEILSWAKSRAKATAGQFNLTLGICRDLPLPLPPPNEQLQIVEEIELQISEVDKLEEVIAANLKRAERLRQTILAEAFAGRLVPQNPDDEPTSVLLERIRREREERDEARKKGKAGNGRARAAMSVPDEEVKIEVEGMEQVELWESVGG